MITRQVRYRERLKAKAFSMFPHDIFGHYCQQCQRDSRYLEFAHKQYTGLMGMGRGSKERYKDVITHPQAYCLLCPECHLAFDKARLKGRRKRTKITLPVTFEAQQCVQ
jgi:hypothetical protein